MTLVSALVAAVAVVLIEALGCDRVNEPYYIASYASQELGCNTDPLKPWNAVVSVRSVDARAQLA